MSSMRIGRAASRGYRPIGTQWTGAAPSKKFRAANAALRVFAL